MMNLYEDINTRLNLLEKFSMDKWGERDITEQYTFTDTFSDEEIDWIIKNCSELTPIAGEIGSDYESVTIVNKVRSSVIRWIPINEDTRFIYERMYQLINEANNNLWGFDLTGFIEGIQYTEYYGSDEGHYDWHLDVGPDVDYRKISITIQISDPSEYEGGELIIKTGPKDIVVPKEKGLATLFPSFLLHRVSNVKSGVRRSLVLWVTGPAFR